MVRAGIVSDARTGLSEAGNGSPELISYSRNTNIGFREYLQKLKEFEEPEIEKLSAVFRGTKAASGCGIYVDYDDPLWLFAPRCTMNAWTTCAG